MPVDRARWRARRCAGIARVQRQCQPSQELSWSGTRSPCRHSGVLSYSSSGRGRGPRDCRLMFRKSHMTRPTAWLCFGGPSWNTSIETGFLSLSLGMCFRHAKPHRTSVIETLVRGGGGGGGACGLACPKAFRLITNRFRSMSLRRPSKAKQAKTLCPRSRL